MPRTVRLLGAVSLLNDLASEMIYPLLPIFLTSTIKGGATALGVIEGLAEAVSSLLKLIAGRLSDRTRRRKPWIVVGYACATLLRPLTALAQAPWHVLTVRLIDRIGKGIRASPRDALLADVTPIEQRGRAFGFQRAMDHTGALLGPLAASALLVCGFDIRTVFALALVPGLAALIVLIAGLREPGAPDVITERQVEEDAPLSRPLKRYLAMVVVFTLANSSDAFLLLRARELGCSVATLPLLWSWHHLIKSLASTRGGALSDRFGRRPLLALAWGLYAAAYLGFALASRPLHVFALFAVYGLFHALSEGPERALIADLAPRAARGRAFGWYHAVVGLSVLPASAWTGWLWTRTGAPAPLAISAIFALLAACGLIWLVPSSTTIRPASH